MPVTPSKIVVPSYGNKAELLEATCNAANKLIGTALDQSEMVTSFTSERTTGGHLLLVAHTAPWSRR